MYQKVGFDVHLEPLPPRSESRNSGPGKEGGECRACFVGFEDQYRIIFTRPKRDKKAAIEDDL
jgi:hypothetical protein